MKSEDRKAGYFSDGGMSVYETRHEMDYRKCPSVTGMPPRAEKPIYRPEFTTYDSSVVPKISIEGRGNPNGMLPNPPWIIIQ